jgi:hypothetical protein
MSAELNKNRSVGARTPEPTFLVRSIENSSCPNGQDYLLFFLVMVLLAFRFGERFAFFAVFFLAAMLVGSSEIRAPHTNKQVAEPGVLRFRPAPATMRGS